MERRHPKATSYTSPQHVVAPKDTMHQACSDQTMVAWHIGGNPSQHAAATSDTTTPVQLKALGALGQTRRSKINYIMVTVTQTTMASIPGCGTLDVARA